VPSSSTTSSPTTVAQRLWDRYFTRLVHLCRRRLADYPRRAADEEDAAIIAFESFFEGVQRGRFPQLHDRDDLWRLLVVIAARKAVDLIQHERRDKRGAGAVKSESAFQAVDSTGAPLGIEHVIGDEPTPEFALMVAEEYSRLLHHLADESARKVAQLKLEGYGNDEIAARLECSLRTVERKLWLIRTQWSEEGFRDE